MQMVYRGLISLFLSNGGVSSQYIMYFKMFFFCIMVFYNQKQSTDRVTMWEGEKDAVRNSRLELSIKPFVTIREDIGKSKSVDKTKKGISRVKNQNIIISNSLSSQSQTEKQNYQHHLKTKLEQCNRYATSQQKNSNGTQVDLTNKIQLLEKQLIVIEKQNDEIQNQKNEWKRKCTALFETNKKTISKIQQLQKELLSKQQIILEIQQKLKLKQCYLQSQNEIQQIDKTKNNVIINELSDRIRELVSELELSNNRGIELEKNKNQLLLQIDTINKEFRDNKGMMQKEIAQKEKANILQKEQHIELERLKKLIEKQNDQKCELTQQNRKLLIKSISLAQQKQTLQSKIRTLNIELHTYQTKTNNIIQNYQQLQQNYLNLQQQAIELRKNSKQLQNLYSTKYLNNQLTSRLKQKEIRIQELEQRRINQIQFHHKQLKNIAMSEQQKYEGLIDKFRNERDDLGKQMKEMKIEETEQQKILNTVKKESQILRIQLTDNLRRARQQKQSLEIQYEKNMKEKQEQITKMTNKLLEMKSDNSFLLDQLDKIKQLQLQSKSSIYLINSSIVADRSRSPSQELKQIKQSEVISSCLYPINSQASMLSKQISMKTIGDDRNQQITGKFRHLREYEVEFTKFQDKIRETMKIQQQKYKQQDQSYRLTIKHLIQELEQHKVDKNKKNQQKLSLISQIQILTQQQKNKDSYIASLEDQIKMLSNVLQNQQKKRKDFEIIVEQCSLKIESRDKTINKLTTDIDVLTKRINQQQIISMKKLEQITQQLQFRQAQLTKYKECIALMKEDEQIKKEKIVINEEMTKQQEHMEQQLRIRMYKQYFSALGSKVQIVNMKEKQILTMLHQLIIFNISSQQQLEDKLSTTQIDYKQLLQSEQAANKKIQSQYEEQLEKTKKLLITVQQNHKQKILFIKQDYDAVYQKYLKYRNMVIVKKQEKQNKKKCNGKK